VTSVTFDFLTPFRCFVCYKELDGWEPLDDPFKEHKSHSPKCAFLKLKNPEELSVKEFLELEKTRQLNKIKLKTAQVDSRIRRGSMAVIRVKAPHILRPPGGHPPTS
jgi:hypothetical protein